MGSSVAVEKSERIGGAALLTVPIFDSFVEILDGYARIDLLVNLQSHLPPALLNPAVELVCLVLGLTLLHFSQARQLRRLTENRETRLVDTSGTEIYAKEKPKLLLPVLIAFSIAFLAAPMLAVGYSLAYKGEPPARRPTPIPPAFAYNTTPKPINPSTEIRIPQGPIAIAPNGFANAAPNFGTQTINPGTPEKNWVITEEICRKILAPISASPQSHIDISVGAFISDPDGANVVDQLRRCLPSVSWWGVSGAVLPSVPEGVVIFTAKEDELTAKSLGAGLRSAGFNVPEIQVSDKLKNEIDISIGKRALLRP